LNHFYPAILWFIYFATLFRKTRKTGWQRMAKFSGNPIFDGHLTLPEMAAACDKTEKTVLNWTELPEDPLPHIRLPNGSRIFNIPHVQAWLARRERSAMPVPRRRRVAAGVA
jgi:hypothetical protein